MLTCNILSFFLNYYYCAAILLQASLPTVCNICHEQLREMDIPEHFPELFELVVGHLSTDGLQPLRHKALPQWLTNDVVRY